MKLDCEGVGQKIPVSTSVVGIDENEGLLESKFGVQEGESLGLGEKQG